MTGPITSLGRILDQRPLALRARQRAPARVASATRRRVVLRARIAIDYPTTVDPADLRQRIADAIVAVAQEHGVTVEAVQIGLAADPRWRDTGPPDLLAGDHGSAGDRRR